MAVSFRKLFNDRAELENLMCREVGIAAITPDFSSLGKRDEYYELTIRGKDTSENPASADFVKDFSTVEELASAIEHIKIGVMLEKGMEI